MKWNFKDFRPARRLFQNLTHLRTCSAHGFRQFGLRISCRSRWQVKIRQILGSRRLGSEKQMLARVQAT